MHRKLFAGVVLALVLSISAQRACAGHQDFTLTNKTGVEIHKVFVSPHDKNEWGSDILKKDTFPEGAAFEVVFHRDEEAEDWDIKIEDKDGTAIVWHKLRLTKITKITLKFDGKEATAEIE